MKYCENDRILTEILFWGERGIFIWGEHFRGTTCVPLHKHSHPPSEQCKHVEAVAQDAGKVDKKKLRNSPLTSKYRAELFLNDLYASGKMLVCKFNILQLEMCSLERCKDTKLVHYERLGMC